MKLATRVSRHLKLLAPAVLLAFTSCVTYRISQEDIGKWNELDRPILIREVNVWKPNSVGGVDVDIVWANTSGKTIKYLQMYLTLYNAVGDPVKCSIRGTARLGISATGPYLAEKSQWTSWDTVWYNSTGKNVRIESVQIDWMDGTEITITDRAKIAELVFKDS